VASRLDAAGFGPLRAHAAWARGFREAGRRALVADGAAANGAVWRRWFPHDEPVLDFLHALIPNCLESYWFNAAAQS
jgi:hypothetical protein